MTAQGIDQLTPDTRTVTKAESKRMDCSNTEGKTKNNRRDYRDNEVGHGVSH